MLGLKQNAIGVYEKALPHFSDWTELLDTVARIGYDFLELSIDESDERLDRLYWSGKERQELRKAIEASGVPVRHLCLSGHRRFPFAGSDLSVRERAWDIFHRALDFCGETGIRLIQTQGHDVYYEKSTDDTWNRYMDALEKAAELARESSVMLGLENADMPCVGSIDQAVEIIEKIGNPWLQLYPDIGNVVGHGYDLEAQLRRAISHTIAVHVKDARPGEFRRVPFGSGIVPFHEAFKTLGDIRYRGPFVIEMWNDGPEDPEITARDALRWIRDRME